jgi:SMI1 / KNR4 family (SUKH-1)
VIPFITSEPPATREQVSQVQRELGYDLPEPYAAFLQTRNGGSPELNVSGLAEAQRWGVGVREFFGIDQSPDLDLLEQRRFHEDRVPEDLLPVADAEGGNLICLALTGEHRGAVFFWDHEWESEEDESPGYENVHRIAPDFDALIASLQPPGDRPLPNQVRDAWIDPGFLAEIRDDK